LSYHLKELTPLVKQSARGRYSLSGIGQASMTLFRKVEREKEKQDNNARKYLEKTVGELIFLFVIVGITLMSPLSVDIYLAVQTIYSTLSIELLALMFLVGLSGMILGVILFVFYDRHYFSKRTRTNVAHSLLFSTVISLLLILEAYASYRFVEATVAIDGSMTLNGNIITLVLSVLRTFSFLAITPVAVYLMSKFLNRR